MATTYQQLIAELIGVYIKKNKVKQISDFVHATVKIRAACEILRNLQ